MRKRNLTRRNQKINTYNSLEEINKRLKEKSNNNNHSLKINDNLELENNKPCKIKRTKDKIESKESITTTKSFDELEQFDKIKTRVLKYVFYKKRTSEEVRRKFETTYDKEILNEVIENLIELGYINDKSYISRATNEYMSLKDMSIREIKYKLLSKGLKSKTIDEYFQENYDILKEYELKSARNIATKKSKTMDNIEIKEFLIRKGYTQESIKEAINL